MIEMYERIFAQYKQFIESKTEYYTIDPSKPLVVKNYTSTSPYFPIISCELSNLIDTNYCTVDKIERHDEMYLTINIYTKDKTKNEEKIASQKINDELTELTIQFFNQINMKRTLCRPTPNADTRIMRRTLQYQGLVSSARGNITRR